MASISSLATLIGLFLTIPNASGASQNCSLTFSEVQLAVKPATINQEFIELRVSPGCEGTVNLSSYSLVLWLGEKRSGKSKQPATLHAKSTFTTPGCSLFNTTFLVIGNDMFSTVSSNATFCPFSDFGGLNWPIPHAKGTDSWMDKGNKRKVALVLYKDVTPGELLVNSTLNDATAHRGNIVDLVIYSGSSGSGHDLKKFLFPDYNVGQPGTHDSSYYCLSDINENNITIDTLRSFSYCCDQNVTQWPMGYKWSSPTPGMENHCNFSYVLDPKGTTFKLDTDRCNVSAIINVYPPATTPAPKPTTTTSKPMSVTTVGLAVGITMGIILLVVLVAFAVSVRRRRYVGLGADGQSTFMPLDCFGNRADDQDRLVIDA